MDAKAALGQFKQIRPSTFKGIGTPLLVLAALGMVVLPTDLWILQLFLQYYLWQRY